MPDHICDKAPIVEQHGRDIAHLFSEKNEVASRLIEVETVLFGAERNGGGYFKTHERQHEEEDMALKETMEIVRVGMKTIADQQTELGKKVAKLTDRRHTLRRLAESVLPPAIAAAATIATVLMSR